MSTILIITKLFMIWAIFSTFLSSIAKVFFKTTTQFNIKTELNDLIGHFGALVGLFIIIIIGKFNLGLSDSLNYLLTFISFLLFFTTIKINQYVVRQESISALIPFENLGKVLTVLFGVFLLNDEISKISLFIFLGVVILIMGFSLDLKHLKFSKNILLYCLSQIFTAIAGLITGYILINNSSLDYYSVYTIISLVFMFSLCIFLGLFGQIKGLNKSYYINRGLSSLAWISWLISILLIKELGLSVTTLLSFLGIGISLFTSYIVFKDIPTKKNILLTLAILSLVGAGYYFK